MNSKNREILYTFLDLAEAIREIVIENEDLQKENEQLKEDKKKYFNQIMEGARQSQKGVDDFVNAILKGQIILNNK